MIVGTDGPVVVVPAAVADLVAPPLRTWLRAVEAIVGVDQRQVLRAVTEVVEDLERAAEMYQAMSPGVSSRRHFRAAGPGSGEGVAVTRCTTREAADLLGLHPRRVQRLVAAGVLRAERPGRDLLIDLASVRAELARREAS